jgi:hypothetical protein
MEVTLEVPTPPLVVVSNGMVESLKAELAKCQLDHIQTLEPVYLEHAYKTQGLRAITGKLTIFISKDSKQQELPTMNIIRVRVKILGSRTYVVIRYGGD